RSLAGVVGVAVGRSGTVVVAHERSPCAVGVCGRCPLLGLTVPSEAAGRYSPVAPWGCGAACRGTSPGANQLASWSICSNSRPLVSGTNFQTKTIDSSAIVAEL